MSFFNKLVGEPITSLKIGYIWQYKTGDLSALSATSLHVEAVIQGFNKRGHRVRIITFHESYPHWSDDLVFWHRIEPINRGAWSRIAESVVRGIQSRLHLPYFNLFDSLRFASACIRALEDCDVLYERFWILASGGLMASKKMGIPIIYEVNGDIVEEYTQQGLSLSRLQWAVIHLVTRLMFENAGQVITVSHTLKSKTIRRWRLRKDNVTAIENGALVDLFDYSDQEVVSSIRAKYGLNGNSSIIFVGTFKPWHGLDLLVESFGQVVTSHPDSKLLLVGDGPLRKEIETQVERLNLKENVIFTGLVQHQEVPILLNAADIAVLNPKVSRASVSQSPLKLFEYMASGKAIIAPSIPNTERILTHRQNGLLIPPNDRASLKCALLELIEDEPLRKRLGEDAKRQATEKHSWDRTVEELEKVILELIAGHNKKSDD
jgi:starch synthase